MNPEETNTEEKRLCYYLTLNTVDSIDIFILPVFKSIIVESLNYFIAKRNLIVNAWCLMSNHLHLLVQSREGYFFAEDFKKFTAKIIIDDIEAENESRRTWILKKFEESGRQFKGSDKYQVWQPILSPIFIDLKKPHKVVEYLDHIHNSPVREKIVRLPEDYLYSSAGDYAGTKGLVNVLTLKKTHSQYLYHNFFRTASLYHFD